jgi:hypothetical protein
LLGADDDVQDSLLGWWIWDCGFWMAGEATVLWHSPKIL